MNKIFFTSIENFYVSQSFLNSLGIRLFSKLTAFKNNDMLHAILNQIIYLNKIKSMYIVKAEDILLI